MKFLPENAANKQVVFISSDEEFATVDSKGLVTCKKAGEVRIFIRSEDGNASQTIYLNIEENGTNHVPDIPQVSENPFASDRPDIPQESPAPGKLGDVNQDGTIDLNDAQMALKAALRIYNAG